MSKIRTKKYVLLHKNLVLGDLVPYEIINEDSTRIYYEDHRGALLFLRKEYGKADFLYFNNYQEYHTFVSERYNQVHNLPDYV